MSSNVIRDIIKSGEAVPPKVTGVTVQDGNTQLVVMWDATIADPAVSNYLVRHRVSPAGAFTTVDVGNVLTTTITGLINSTTYDVQVAAVNAKGEGEFSDIVMGTPVAGLPEQVQNLIVNVGVVDNSLDISWDALVATPDSYTYEFKESTQPDGSYIPVNNGLSLSDTISGLKSGVLYNVRVHATNGVGDGPDSAVVSNTPQGVPELIIPFIANFGIEQVGLTWDEPTASPPLTGYNLEFKKSADSLFIAFADIGLVTSQTIFNLESGVEYEFRIQGINSKGSGVFSQIIKAIPTAISVTLAGLHNEVGVDTNNPVTFTNNLGSIGSAWNKTSVFGTAANLVPATRKGLDLIQSLGSAGIQAPGAGGNFVFQAYTIFTCVQPANISASKEILVRDSIGGGVVDQSITNAQGNIFAASDLPVAVTITNGQELIIMGDYSSPTSEVRVILNDGATDVSALGDCGSNGFEFDTILFRSDQLAGSDFEGLFFETRIYDGNLSNAEKDAVFGALQQKWFNGFPFAQPAVVVLVEYNDKGVGLTNPVTEYLNTGTHDDSFDLDSVNGIAANLTPFTRNSLPCLRMGGESSLDAPGAPNPEIVQPTSFIICFNPLLIDTNERYFLRADVGRLTIRVSTSGVIINAGSAVTNPVSLTIDNEVIVFVKVDGASSSVRVIENGGTDTTTAGNLGSNQYAPETLGWNNTSTNNQDLPMIHFESKYYETVLDASEEANEVAAMQTKWFTVGAVPAQVTGLVLTPIADGLQVNWNAVAGATGYVIEFKLATDNVFTVQFEGTNTTADVTGLSVAIYDVKVAATNAIGQGQYSVTLQETPDAPSVALMIYDETGVVSGGQGQPVTAWLNSGSTVGNNDYDTAQGQTGNMQDVAENGMPAIQFNSGSNFFCSNPLAAITSPYTIYMIGRQFSLNSQGRFFFETTSGNVSFVVTNADHELNAGTLLQEITNGQSNNVVFALVVDGASGRLRASGAITFDLTGNAGSNSYQPNTLAWDLARTQNREYTGKMFEKRVYGSAHDTSQIDAVFLELQTKWGVTLLMQDDSGNTLVDDLGKPLINL